MFRITSFLPTLVLGGMGLASGALAQTVVQLPSVHTFSLQTSVLVPDGGSTYLDGVNRGSQGSFSRGWGPQGSNLLRAGTKMGSGVMVHATVIDHEELDVALLAEARAARAAAGIVLVDHSPPDAGLVAEKIESVAAIQRQLAAEDAAREAEAERDFAKALAYEQAGDFSLARNYYRVAGRKSQGEVRARAIARLTSLRAAGK